MLNILRSHFIHVVVSGRAKCVRCYCIDVETLMGKVKKVSSYRQRRSKEELEARKLQARTGATRYCVYGLCKSDSRNFISITAFWVSPPAFNDHCNHRLSYNLKTVVMNVFFISLIVRWRSTWRVSSNNLVHFIYHLTLTVVWRSISCRLLRLKCHLLPLVYPITSANSVIVT